MTDILLFLGRFCDTCFEYTINKRVVAQGKRNNSMINNALRGVNEEQI